jgi:hypothetical protein
MKQIRKRKINLIELNFPKIHGHGVRQCPVLYFLQEEKVCLSTLLRYVYIVIIQAIHTKSTFMIEALPVNNLRV